MLACINLSGDCALYRFKRLGGPQRDRLVAYTSKEPIKLLASYFIPFSSCLPNESLHSLDTGALNSARLVIHPLYIQLLQVLLNSLCRVLYTVRSLYLCSIGLVPVFSLTKDILRFSSCNSKQLYSLVNRHTQPTNERVRQNKITTGLSPLLECRSKQLARTPLHGRSSV